MTKWNGSFYHREGRDKNERESWRNRWSGNIIYGNKNMSKEELMRNSGKSKLKEPTRASPYGLNPRSIAKSRQDEKEFNRMRKINPARY